MENFRLEIHNYGYGRLLEEAPYQHIGTQLLNTVEVFLSTNWGSGKSSRGVSYGHFNTISEARSHLRSADPELFVSKAVPALKRLRDDLLSEEGRGRSMASEREYGFFIRDFDGYLAAVLLEIENSHWLALRVQEHFRAFAGELNVAWQLARRLDPDQPLVDTKLFHKLAELRDRVFEQTSVANMDAYLAEVELLKRGSYDTILSYVQNQARTEKRLKSYEASALEQLEDELAVEALWVEQTRG